MPRRESYQTDDDDYDDRRAGASGGGVPGWVWVVGGGGVLAVLVVVGLGFFMFTARREAAVRHEVARADMMRAEVQTRPAEVVEAEQAPDGPAGPALQPLSLARITNAYKNDRGAADVRYTNKRVRVRVEVKTTDEGWVGASADLGDGPPGGMASNVIFRLNDRVVAGTTVVIEGWCGGLSPDPLVGERLVFTGCRVVRE